MKDKIKTKKEISFKAKLAGLFFILGKLLSIPTIILILSGKEEKFLVFLYFYVFFIFMSIIICFYPEKKKEKNNLPDGIFRFDDVIIEIKNGVIKELKKL